MMVMVVPFPATRTRSPWIEAAVLGLFVFRSRALEDLGLVVRVGYGAASDDDPADKNKVVTGTLKKMGDKFMFGVLKTHHNYLAVWEEIDSQDLSSFILPFRDEHRGSDHSRIHPVRARIHVCFLVALEQKYRVFVYATGRVADSSNKPAQGTCGTIVTSLARCTSDLLGLYTRRPYYQGVCGYSALVFSGGKNLRMVLQRCKKGPKDKNKNNNEDGSWPRPSWVTISSIIYGLAYLGNGLPARRTPKIWRRSQCV